MKKPNDTMQAILDVHASMGPLPIETLNAEQARLVPLLDRAAVGYYGTHFTKKALAPMPMPVGKVENRLIPSPGGEQMIRVYTPKGEAPKSGWPVVLYFHGGGWVIADLDTYDSAPRALCQGAECVVVSAHYRQAPEYQWPAAHEDAFNVYQWLLNNVSSVKGNIEKIAVAGESAGGNMATAVCHYARNNNLPMPVHQVLVYPVTDMVKGVQNLSARENASAKPLNKAMLTWFYDKYVPDGQDRADPYASPLYGETKGLPSATVILAEIDPLRSEGEEYARKLEASQVPVNLKIYEGVTHEFYGLAGLLSEATDAVKTSVTDLKEAFAGRSPSRIAA